MHLFFLHKVRGHDNDPTLPVVHHLPEVPTCALHGALSDDVSILELVALSRDGKTEWVSHKQTESVLLLFSDANLQFCRKSKLCMKLKLMFLFTLSSLTLIFVACM